MVFVIPKVQFPNSNVATKRYDKRYDNRTATYNGHNSLAGLGKYGYGNGFFIGTTLMALKMCKFSTKISNRTQT